jgi:molybdopterin-guanine dinucleotide biosynthesis protein A
LQDYLDGGRRSVHGWLATVKAVPVDFDDAPDQFVNVNCEDDQRRLETLLGA